MYTKYYVTKDYLCMMPFPKDLFASMTGWWFSNDEGDLCKHLLAMMLDCNTHYLILASWG